ncbi:hypothetical protein [Microbacterium sp. 2RAF4]|uniref:hypothetical protein n=1 Tax=Microbacterium sp. 2RAF4 TaxID=3232999 RepID=UPI003F9D2DA3
MGGTLIKTDLGHGRGWASPKAAASIRRIDAQLGRIADINEAGRSPEQANKNRAAWLAYERYLNGGPWAPKAPYALGADQSVHCWGNAADSDDWYNAHAAAVWRDNGWKQTARYFDRNGRPTAKDEPWHGEYFEHLDNHRNDPAPSGGAATTPPLEEDEMLVLKIDAGVQGTHVCTLAPKTFSHVIKEDNAEWVKNVIRADDRYTDIVLSQLPVLLRRYGCDLHIWDIRNGQFVVLDPLTGVASSGAVWTVENVIRSSVEQIKITSAATSAYVEHLAKSVNGTAA